MSRWAWLLFGALVLSALALDLGLLQRSRGEQRVLSLRAAAGRSIAWIALSLLFGVVVFVGARLLLSEVIEVPNHVSLGLIAAALGLSVIASIKWPGPQPA